MTLTLNTILVPLYLVIVAGLIFLAHRQTHVRWARYERSRITLGVLCVVLPDVILINLVTWQALVTVFVGFCVAGMVTIGLDHEHELRGFEEALSGDKVG